MPSAPQLNGTSFDRQIQFLSIDLTEWGGTIQRFVDTSTYASIDGLPENGSVTWNSQSWQALPFQTGGFQSGGENQVRPSVQVADFNGTLYVALRGYDFAPGAPVNRYLAFAADVESGNPYAIFQQEEYVLNSVQRERGCLNIELATHFDWAQMKVPGYTMTREDFPGLGSALLR